MKKRRILLVLILLIIITCIIVKINKKENKSNDSVETMANVEQKQESRTVKISAVRRLYNRMGS